MAIVPCLTKEPQAVCIRQDYNEPHELDPNDVPPAAQRRSSDCDVVLVDLYEEADDDYEDFEHEMARCWYAGIQGHTL